MRELVIGGARSGKSAYAEKQARDSGLRVVYVATAQVLDGEMERRVAVHRARRPAQWGLVECAGVGSSPGLFETLRHNAAPDTCLLVDCLTLWLSNLLFAGAAAQQAEAGEKPDCPLFRREMQALIEGLPQLPGEIILVSNEVGCGIVPMNAISRLFADEQGRLNQRVAAVCERVTLVAAGLPLALKR